MSRPAWLTDLHLNFVDAERLERLVDEIRAARPDGLLIGGDIAEAPTFAAGLEHLSDAAGVPIWFVLGNHDYYHGSIRDVREAARTLSRQSNGIHWLPDAGAIPIDETTALVGHGGWGDGRSGDFFGSDVVLNDYGLIAELAESSGAGSGAGIRRPLPAKLLEQLHALGDEAAAHFREVVPTALASAEHVLVLMHVPPFRDACRDRGRISDDNWAPHFVCQAAGAVLAEIMSERPGQRMTVLCGHTHGAADVDVLPNLRVLTGEAEYGEPAVQRVLDTAER